MCLNLGFVVHPESLSASALLVREAGVVWDGVNATRSQLPRHIFALLAGEAVDHPCVVSIIFLNQTRNFFDRVTPFLLADRVYEIRPVEARQEPLRISDLQLVENV